MSPVASGGPVCDRREPMGRALFRPPAGRTRALDRGFGFTDRPALPIFGRWCLGSLERERGYPQAISSNTISPIRPKMKSHATRRGLAQFPAVAAMLLGITAVAAAAADLTNLRCEYLANPLGSDVTKPRLSWVIADSGQRSEERGRQQSAYQVLVATTPELLAKDTGDLWDSGKVASDQSTQVEYAGIPLESRLSCHWKARVWLNDDKATEWSQPALWTMGLLKPDDWQGKWIGLDRHDASAAANDPEQRRLPARYLRRDFTVDKEIVQATAHVCGLGLFELQLNGRKVGNHCLDPGLTQYDKRALYVTFDVSKELRAGSNTIGVTLGNGRFYAMRTKVPFPMHNFGFPKLLMQLEIAYRDGTRQTVISDENWRVTDAGPIRSNSEYDGEEYDARMELPGWAEPGYDAAAWEKAAVVAAPQGRLQAQMIEPIRVTDVRKPVAISQPRPAMFLLDMGQAYYGTVRLTVAGPAGTRVQLRSAYDLNADGTLRIQDNRSAKTTDIYVLKGGGAETWAPRFRGQGYRYVEVTGFPGTPALENFEGLVMHTDFAAAGGFRCSNELVNRIHDNIRWTQRAYVRSVPMEPDRDERMGWLGTQAKDFESNCCNFDMAALLEKWLEDIRLDQLPDGHLPDVAPTYWAMYNQGIVWPSNIAILPEILHDLYGDRRALEANYAALTLWLKFISRHLKPDSTVDLSKYGDWCDAYSMDGGRETGGTPDPLIGTAYFHNNCRIAARIAGLLGKPDDAKHFTELAAKINEGFNRRFFDKEKHTYGPGTQTCDVLPLAFGMVPLDQRAAVAGHLAHNVLVERKGHLSVGMVGVFWLMQVLTETGHADAAWTVVTQTTRPSWGYMISKGATSVWERWDSDTRGPGMNSEALLILAGNLDAWFYRTLGGIQCDPEIPGFKHIIMRPQPPADLAWVNVHYDSIHGRIVSNWKREGVDLTMEVTIPINTTATLHVPARDGAAVTESGKPAAQAQGVRFLRMENGAAVYALGSGHYQFHSGSGGR